jgi:hypothetical protein
MEKEFVPYEQALALKELGFDEPCLTWWNKKEFVYPYWEREFGYNYESGIAKDCVLSPLYQQAFRWFREKYSIQSTIEPTKDQHRFELGFNYWIWNTKTGEEWFTEPKNRPAGDYVFDSYEEAELECLKKLIEIVKNK